MTQRPLLIISDAPTSNTGLGRICRDLAQRIHVYLPDLFRVATLGYGGTGSRNLPFPQYAIQSPVTENGWYIPEIQHVWDDFAEGERGVVFTIWDPSRMRWFARPEYPQTVPHPELAAWLTAPPFEKWGYLPIDASGPNGKLTAVLGNTIKGYDRALCYSEWAENIVRETVGAKHSERLRLSSLPHGINTFSFQPRGKQQARQNFRNIGFSGLTDSAFLVGIVATNQARKDYGLGIATCASLMSKGLDLRLWIHTDTLKRYWDLVALLTDFDLLGRVVITTQNFSDEQMSWLYSACDVTLGIGLGEGFGYPIFESLACGVPCVHGDYGGAAEHLPKQLKLQVWGWRFEGQFNCRRPNFHPSEWAQTAEASREAEGVSLPQKLDWNNLWPKWEKWFRKGESR